MTAWQKLLAASSLTSGTAWQLISNPRIGSGVVVNDGIAVDVAEEPFLVELDAMQLDVELSDAAVEVELADAVVVAEISPEPIEVEITP
jgi:hypothetical protein